MPGQFQLSIDQAVIEARDLAAEFQRAREQVLAVTGAVLIAFAVVNASGVAGIFGYHCLLFTAFRTAPALEANLLNYLWPLLIVVLSPLFGLGKLTSRHILAATVGFFGAVLIVSKGQFDFADSLPIGYLFAIAAAFTWSSYSLATRKLPPFPNAAVGGFCLLSSLLAALCHWLFEPAIVPNNEEWLALLLMGIGPLGASFFLWDKAMKEGDPKQIGALSYLTPLLSTLILAVSGLGELNTITWIAGALILLGATIATARTEVSPPRDRVVRAMATR